MVLPAKPGRPAASFSLIGWFRVWKKVPFPRPNPGCVSPRPCPPKRNEITATSCPRVSRRSCASGQQIHEGKWASSLSSSLSNAAPGRVRSRFGACTAPPRVRRRNGRRPSGTPQLGRGAGPGQRSLGWDFRSCVSGSGVLAPCPAWGTRGEPPLTVPRGQGPWTEAETQVPPLF